MVPTRMACLLFAPLLLAATPAAAHGPFEMIAVGDDRLDGIRGTLSPTTFMLTVGQLDRIQDNVGQDSFRLAGSINGIGMDNWWATTGADLVAASADARP